MDVDELRAFVREVLGEELAARRGSSTGERTASVETVALRTDADLMAFVRRLLRASAEERRAIEDGRREFRLAVQAPATPARGGQAAATVFARGLVGEAQIEALDESVRCVEAGKRVRFTPLAIDRLRQRGIAVKRTKT